MNLQIQIQGNTQQTPNNKLTFQSNIDVNESQFLSPKNDSITQRQYKIRTYQPKSVMCADQFTKLTKSKKYLTSYECVKCKGEKSLNAIKLCHCQDNYYHKICILDYAELYPKLGIELFRCQFCNEYFPLKLKEKLSLSNLTQKEKIIFLITLPFILLLLILEISLIAILNLEFIYFIVILILIIFELLIALIAVSKVYHLSYLIEYDLMEYKIGQEYDQIQLENQVMKVVKQLQYQRAKRIVIDSSV